MPDIDGRYKFKMIDNYIYMYHTQTLIALPTFPQSISDTMGVNFQTTDPLMRSAPIYSYTKSGPRSLQISLNLHRDLMGDISYISSKLNIQAGSNSLTNLNDDYVDTIIKEIQACSVPKYGAGEKMVDPPMVAVRIGDDVYIKGVVEGQVNVEYSGPILRTNKYAQVNVQFTVKEVDPFDASSIMQFGSFRGLDTTLEGAIWKA